jgi:hypothetical protein
MPCLPATRRDPGGQTSDQFGRIVVSQTLAGECDQSVTAGCKLFDHAAIFYLGFQLRKDKPFSLTSEISVPGHQ